MIKGKRVLITGSAGSIGSELARQLAPDNSLFLLDNNETGYFDLFEELLHKGYVVSGRVGDIRDAGLLKEIIPPFNPQFVFHAAAYKHVPLMEQFPIEAVNTNILGTFNVLQALKPLGFSLEKCIFISTDKVVNGDSIMGATKKVAELMVKSAGHIAVRFGNVLGSRGSVVPIWQRQLERGEPITVTDERMERYFMSIEEACALVIKAAEIGKPGQMLVLDMGEPVNVLKAAKQILGKLGKEDYPIKMIGARPGEAFSEQLMTKEERERAKRVGNFLII